LEENKTSRVDISSLGKLAAALSDLFGSVVSGSSADDDEVFFLIRRVEVGDFKFEVVSQKKVFKLEVQMGTIVLVKVFKTRNKVMEEGPCELLVHVDPLIED